MQMPSSQNFPASHAFRDGIKDALPFLLVITPFGMLFGVVATEAGLNIVETMAMTFLVIAGAAQFTAIALLEENTPTLIVILTALAVNLRMALYSASLAPFLGRAPLWKRALIAYMLVDQSYAAAQAYYAKRPALSLAERLGYFWGVVLPIIPIWYLSTWLGAVGGAAIPPEYALDFAVPITFIALFAPLLRSLPHLVSASVSIALTLALMWVPYSLGLIIAACFAMPAGALTEIWQERMQ